MEKQPAGRITAGQGLDYLDAQLRRYAKFSVVQRCELEFQKDTAYTAALRRNAAMATPDYSAVSAARRLTESFAFDLCDEVAATDTVTAGTGITASARRRLIDTYMARRQAELALVSSLLRSRIGYGDVISADEERAVGYLDRLASKVREGDGALGAEIINDADRAMAWRDARVDAGAITRDLQQELSMRRAFANREATFQRNRELSARIAASKGARTAAQSDSARKAICAGFGIAPGECPP